MPDFTNVLLAALAAGLLNGCADTRPTDPWNRVIDETLSLGIGPLEACDKRDFDKPPNVRLAFRPIYPISRRMASQTDNVTAKFRIDAAGKIEDVQVSSSNTTDPEAIWFRNHTVIAIRGWKVDPASKAGSPVATSCTIVFYYKIG